MDMKKILQALDTTASKPVESSDDMKKFLSVITEGANPHKVALPVQMAMNHYQTPKQPTVKKESLFKKYFAEAEEQATAELEADRLIREQRIKQYARKIANRVLEGKESAREKWTKASNEREKKHQEREAEIAKLPKEKRSGAAIDALEKHLKANEGWSDAIVAQRTGRPRTPYSVYIKGKKWKDFENDDYAEAVANKLRAKFKADGRDPSVITIAPTDYDKGVAESTNRPDTVSVDVPLLIRLLEYAREDAKDDMVLHNMAENMVNLCSSGDTLGMDDYNKIIPSDDIDQSLPEGSDPCWKNYKQIGMKKKGGKKVPNCVPKSK